jgi:hypothetical protein
VTPNAKRYSAIALLISISTKGRLQLSLSAGSVAKMGGHKTTRTIWWCYEESRLEYILIRVEFNLVDSYIEPNTQTHKLFCVLFMNHELMQGSLRASCKSFGRSGGRDTLHEST